MSKYCQKLLAEYYPKNGQKSDLRRDNLITVLLCSNMETPHTLWQHTQIFD